MNRHHFDVDIPQPKSRDKLNVKEMYSHRPTPSLRIGSSLAHDGLKTIINKQNQLLIWYSSQIKDCPKSSFRIEAVDSDVVSVLPLINAYDQRLALAEDAVKTIQSKLDDQSKCNQQLLKSQSLNADACKETSLKKENDNDQAEDLEWFKEENTFLASQIFELIKKFEQGSKFNHDVLKHCDVLKRKIGNTETKFSSLVQDYEGAIRWITARKDLVKDYEACIDSLGLANMLDLKNYDKSSNILSTKVALIIKEMVDLKRNVNEYKQRFQSIKDDNASLIKKFLFEIEKKNSELEVAKTRIAEVNHLVDRSNADKRAAENEALKASKASIYMEDHYKNMIRERDDQISDIILKSKNELKSIRDEFDLEKSRLNFEMDELKKSKVELQAEIGHLLRDKRRAELDLETVQRVFVFEIIKSIE